MSYLLEVLGRGLLRELRQAFEPHWVGIAGDQADELEQRAARSPTSGDLQLRLGLARLRDGRYAAARRALESATRLLPQSSKPLLGLACVHEANADRRAALRCLETARRLDESDAAITFALGLLHEHLDQPDVAQRWYRETSALCPQLRNACERLAALALRRGDAGAACDCYAQLAEMDPQELDTLLTAGCLELETGQAALAAARFQQALFVEPETDEGPRVEDVGREGGLEAAILSFERLVRQQPGVAAYHVQLGDLYVRAGKDRDAVAEYEAALATQPAFLEATVKLGTQHMRQGRSVAAAVTFNRAIELNDRLMLAFIGLGLAQHAQGHARESRATLDLAASLEPSTTLLFAESARLCLAPAGASGALDGADTPPNDPFLEDALRRHEQALLRTPGQADLHYRYGLLLRHVGRSADAAAAFQRAVALNPHYVRALVKLGLCERDQGQADAARARFERALRLQAGAVESHYQLGLLYARGEQFDAAVDAFEQRAGTRVEADQARATILLALENVGLVDRPVLTWRMERALAARPDQLESREGTLRSLDQPGP